MGPGEVNKCHRDLEFDMVLSSSVLPDHQIRQKEACWETQNKVCQSGKGMLSNSG